MKKVRTRTNQISPLAKLVLLETTVKTVQIRKRHVLPGFTALMKLGMKLNSLAHLVLIILTLQPKCQTIQTLLQEE